MAEQTTVTRNDEARRYEIRVDGTVAGFSDFRIRDGRTAVTHTEVDKAYGGRGLGTTLVSETLADLARRGDTVVPLCPFVASHLKENDVAGLVVAWPHEADSADAARVGEQSS